MHPAGKRSRRRKDGYKSIARYFLRAVRGAQVLSVTRSTRRGGMLLKISHLKLLVSYEHMMQMSRNCRICRKQGLQKYDFHDFYLHNLVYNALFQVDKILRECEKFNSMLILHFFHRNPLFHTRSFRFGSRRLSPYPCFLKETPCSGIRGKPGLY